MESLEKTVRTTLKEACSDLLLPESFKHDVHKICNRDLSLDECNELRKKAINEFLDTVDSKMKEIYEEYDLPTTFANMKKTVNQYDDVSKSTLIGWRSTDDPKIDSFAYRRPALLETIAHLEKYKAELEDQYQKSTTNYSNLKEEIKKMSSEL